MVIDIPSEGVPGLFVHRAPHTAALATGLAGVLSAPLSDPFATEIVSVPTPGVERWLSQTLAATLGASGMGDGVAAGIDFVNLDRLLRRTVLEVLEIDPALDPWQPDRGILAVLRVLTETSGQSWAAPIRSQLDPGSPVARRYATAARVFRLFLAYAAQRPELLRRWSMGDHVDATGSPLPDSSRWQAELWRALRSDLGGPDPVERLDRAVNLLRSTPTASTLPGRISVFGATRLAPDQTSLLSALAEHRAVHLWLPHPSPAVWDRVRGSVAQLGPGPRRDDPTTVLPGHRLIRRLGREARELQMCLAAVPTVDQPLPESPAEPSAHLLARLQSAIRNDVTEPLREPVDPADDSIRFHACHGTDRQVEVLREVVLGLLADHPDLEPRDLIVMCPDIERFAPLMSAVFGLAGLPDGETHPGQALHVRLADRSLRELNPLLRTLQELLLLGDSRAGMSQILDLCADPPIARCFGFREKDLERLRDLVPRSGVRWGLDQGHRQRFSMGGYVQNTWRAGLERMLLGVAMDDHDHRVQGTVLGLADVESSDVDLIGRLVELVSRLRAIADSFSQPQSLDTWVVACRSALDLVTEVGLSDTWQRTHAWTELSRLAEAGRGASGDATEVLLTPGDIRAILAEAFAGRPSRANFRTGSLTLCTMTPMRSVPHRAVILLGLDDGAFPRRGRRDGDDLLAAEPWIGDRDPRSEDRQILLDAVLAARDHLVVIHSGASPQTGERRPPAVPLAEVRAAITELCIDDPWSELEVRHPLQPFSPANFHPRRISFDPIACNAAQALVRTHDRPALHPRRVVDTTGLTTPEELTGDRITIDLADLVEFFDHPAKHLLRRRAQLTTWSSDSRQPDEIPIELDGLDEWAIGERMLRAHLTGVDLRAIETAEFVRGDLPPRARGAQALARIADRVTAIRHKASPWLELPADSRWISVDLGRYHVTGLVAGIRDRTLLRTGYSSLSGRQRLRSWIELLALKTAEPATQWRAATIGRDGRGTLLGPVAEADARARLQELISLRVRGSSELIPLPPKTAAVEAEAGRRDGEADRVLKQWQWEHDDLWARFGLTDWLTSLHSQPADPRDRIANLSAFGSLARRIWNPLLDAEGKL
ncbi:exodeoxyribonuclease V subunit gamma [Ammonicoccus fulvus]|uniref:RecBCD enzyme subunit RecC n=1 Tax=Ammonicoccus fulvus TaxID=3138240 RepID=A0ABZ3FMI3_9ACTN